MGIATVSGLLTFSINVIEWELGGSLRLPLPPYIFGFNY